jgi:MFS family permease
VRRLLVLTWLIMMVDTLLYAALAPLLPHFAHELGLSKAFAGVLVGAYAFGALVAALPGGFAAARLGPRRAVIGGLTLFVVASVAFAFASGFPALLIARFAQGVSSALTWAGAFTWLIAAAPRERRGELAGAAMAAAVFGALLGPALGAVAALLGRGPVFTGVAVVGAVLALAASRLPDASAEEPSLGAILRAVRTRRFLGGLGLMSLPSLLFGVLGVLGPLHLSAAGWGSTAIGTTWIVGAAIEAVQAPLIGRVSDRHGRLLPVRIALLASAVLALVLAAGSRPLLYAPALVLASTAYGALFTPGLALIADGAEDAGLAQGLAFGTMNAAWAIGAVVGPAGAGALADVTGDALPYLLCSAACLASFLFVRPRRSNHERAAVLVDGLPGDATSVGRE